VADAVGASSAIRAVAPAATQSPVVARGLHVSFIGLFLPGEDLPDRCNVAATRWFKSELTVGEVVRSAPPWAKAHLVSTGSGSAEVLHRGDASDRGCRRRLVE
jgi:hypothetical protein